LTEVGKDHQHYPAAVIEVGDHGVIPQPDPAVSVTFHGDRQNHHKILDLVDIAVDLLPENLAVILVNSAVNLAWGLDYLMD